MHSFDLLVIRPPPHFSTTKSPGIVHARDDWSNWFAWFEMGVAVSTGMDESSSEPTLDEFLRQLQAEMDIADQIPDKEERNQRQWQIAIAGNTSQK